MTSTTEGKTPEFKASYDDLRKCSVLIATPMYGGQGFTKYMMSLLHLTKHLTQAGIDHNFYMLSGESLIPRARNDCAHFFMTKTPYTHLLFIDADVGFDVQAVLDLLIIHVSDPDKYKLITAAYPKKTISWEKVYAAAISGKLDSPLELKNYVADLVFNTEEETGVIQLDRPVQVKEAGTGFMLISREVLDKFKQTYYNRRYISDMVRSETVDQEMVMYFQSEIDPDTKRYLSEDYLFCKLVRQMGESVWLLPWINLTHTGSFTYAGNVEGMAQLGIPLTATVAVKEMYKQGKK